MHKRYIRCFTPIIMAIFILGGMFFFVKSQRVVARVEFGEEGSGLGSNSQNERDSSGEDIQISVDEVVVGGLVNPIHLTHAGDGSGRMFVVEQAGRILILQNGELIQEPFLDIEEEVLSGGERGLLSVAFHPDYESNRYFYVNYTRNPDGATVVARYETSGNPNVADPTSSKTLLTVAQPYANHNGGQLAFGADGYLYIGMGDGGSGGDPQNFAQNLNSLLGKILRLDVDHGDPYAIPSDNPFANQEGLDEIWALGLRNPWRFSFDGETGDQYIGDVGQNDWEEIDFQSVNIPGGINYGWRCKEGTHIYNTAPPCDNPTFLDSLIDPVTEYNHSSGQSVTGGYVYRGKLFPALTGYYFFADYVNGKIWSLDASSPGQWSQPILELDTNLNISSFGVDESGELYILDYKGGTVRRLVDARGPSPELSSSVKNVSPTSASAGDEVTYTIQLFNNGGLSEDLVVLTDTIPSGLTYLEGTLAASRGDVFDSQAPTLYWQGAFTDTQPVTITYQAAVNELTTGNLVNMAHIAVPGRDKVTLFEVLTIPLSGASTTSDDFTFPGTQPESLNDIIPLPVACDRCHTEPIYDRWQGSMMSQSGKDPLMWAALTIANFDAPGAGEYCLRCHAPKGWLEGRSHPADGSALQESDLEAGVACQICHRMVDQSPPAGSLPDEAWAIDHDIRNNLTTTLPLSHTGSAMMVVDPKDNRRGPFSLGIEFEYHLPEKTYQTNYLGGTPDDYLTRSRLCGTCHNVDNPVLSWNGEQFWPNEMALPAPSFNDGDLFPIETTYSEWLNSEYALNGVYAPQFAGEKSDGMVGACQDCHMRRSSGLAATGGDYRDCETNGCLPKHEFVGGNTWVPQILQDGRWRLNSQIHEDYLDMSVYLTRQMLRRSATLTVTLSKEDNNKVARVRITNETGHKLPTGYPEGRRMWISLKAYDSHGSLIYQSGGYDYQTGILESGSKVYEAKQGLTSELGAFLDRESGESFHFVLNNTVVKDNRIPPRGYTVAAFAKPGLEPVGATYMDGQYWDDTLFTLPLETSFVRVILSYQTASKEYIDFLRTYGSRDGELVGQLWDSLKSPPEVIASTWAGIPPIYMPLIYR